MQNAGAESALARLANAHALFIRLDADGCVLEANQKACELLACDQEALRGKALATLSAGLHPAEFWKTLFEQLQTEQQWHGEVACRRFDGQTIWTQCTLIADTQSGALNWLGLFTDVSAQHQKDALLVQTSERLALALEGGNDGLWDWPDVRHDAAWWSPQFYRLLGLEPDEDAASRSAFEALMHPDDLPRVTEVMAQAVIGGWPYQVEHRMRMRTGAYRWFRVSGKVINLDRSARVTGSMQDIHALKQAQAELSAVLALSPDGFIAFDEHGLAAYLSPAVDKLLPQLATGMLMARPLTEVLQQLALQGKAPEPIAAEALVEGPQVLLLHDGRALRLDLEQHEGGAVTQLLQLRDVTAELAADRMKAEFLSTAAHELRTPMTTILGFVELLLHRPDMTPDRQRQCLEKVYRQSRTMVAITNDLLDLSRLEAGGQALLDNAPLDLPAWLTGQLDAFEPPADRRAPLLQLAPGMPALRTDGQLLARALSALLANAYKFSAPDTEVLLRLHSDADWAILEVVDHGRGMSAEELRHVGVRFWRADKSGNQLGAGLGLALAKAACSHLGGHLSLRSSLGLGTTAEIRLPLRPETH